MSSNLYGQALWVVQMMSSIFLFHVLVWRSFLSSSHYCLLPRYSLLVALVSGRERKIQFNLNFDGTISQLLTRLE